MSTKESHYEAKASTYGIGHTRRRKILELLDSISHATILDIGCARGYLGAKLRERDNVVVGLDISASVVAQARDVLDEAYVADIEQALPTEVASRQFDAVVMAEVIEHVFDPVDVLQRVASVVKPGGVLILTTPNFLKWTHRLKFLFGAFRYSDQGALDFGHIRHFTYAYLKEVIRETGFVLERENHIYFPGTLSSVLRIWPSLFASQFIVKLIKKS